MRNSLIVLVACVAIAFDLAGCISQGRLSDANNDVEATSLLGEPLVRPVLDEATRKTFAANLAAAQSDYDTAPDDEQAIIWLGRRTAYMGRYRDAVDIYTRGLVIHPTSYRLLRHRGHRYITLRQFDHAERDLSRAAELIEGVPDEVEADGLPNARNIPTSTSHTNIYYHLGLARYLQGKYAEALPAYEACMTFSKNNDMRVATAYWMFLTLVKLDRLDDAHRVLETISPDMDIIENTSYHRLLLAFKGDADVISTLEAALEEGGVDGGTIGYGLACRHAAHGEAAKADAMRRRVIEGDTWAAFGYIAAEAELARREGR